MNWFNFKRAAADYFTPAEIIEFFDISTEELLALLDDADYVDSDVQREIEEIMGIDDDSD